MKNLVPQKAKHEKIMVPDTAYGNIRLNCPFAVKKPNTHPSNPIQKRVNHIGGFGGIYL